MDLRFSLGEERTIVSSKISVSPRVEGSGDYSSNLSILGTILIFHTVVVSCSFALINQKISSFFCNRCYNLVK